MDASALLRKLYSVGDCGVAQIKELISFDDQNFLVRLADGEHLGEVEGTREFILKVINSEDSSDRVAFELQVSVLRFLRGRGFCCAKPVVNAKGDYLSLEKMYKVDGGSGCEDRQQQYGLFLVFLLIYLPGQMISKIKQVPLQLCFDAGVKLAEMDQILWDFQDVPDSFKRRAVKNVWSTECFPRVRKYLDEVKDDRSRKLAESIFKTFEDVLAPKIGTLRKCLIHNDYNDDNILVTERFQGPTSNIHEPSGTGETKLHPLLQFDITGVIDFTDMIYSCLVFEIATAMTFTLYWHVDDPIAATGHLLAGFQQVIPLTREELDLLYICMVVHLVKDLVLSLHAHCLQPDNKHVMQTQWGWRFVEELWGDPAAKKRVEKMWEEIADSYRN